MTDVNSALRQGKEYPGKKILGLETGNTDWLIVYRGEAPPRLPLSPGALQTYNKP